MFDSGQWAVEVNVSTHVQLLKSRAQQRAQPVGPLQNRQCMFDHGQWTVEWSQREYTHEAARTKATTGNIRVCYMHALHLHACMHMLYRCLPAGPQT